LSRSDPQARFIIQFPACFQGFGCSPGCDEHGLEGTPGLIGRVAKSNQGQEAVWRRHVACKLLEDRKAARDLAPLQTQPIPFRTGLPDMCPVEGDLEIAEA
jgi:hypothetical protein